MTRSVVACASPAFARQGAARPDREDVQAPGRGRGRARPGRALDRPGDPRESAPAGRAAHRRGSRDQGGRAVQVHRAGRGPVPGHAQGLQWSSPVAPAGQGDRRAGRGGARGLPAPADRVQAGRRPPADRRHRPGVGRDVRAGGGAQAEEAPGGDRSRERRRGTAAGLASRLRGKPIGGDPVEVDYTCPPKGWPRRWRASRCTCTCPSKRCAKRRCPRSTTKWRRIRARQRRWRGCAARCASGWSSVDDRRIKRR